MTCEDVSGGTDIPSNHVGGDPVDKHETAASGQSWCPFPESSSSVQTIRDIFKEPCRILGLRPPCSVGDALTCAVSMGNELSETNTLQQDLSQENIVLVRKCDVL